MSIRTSTKKGTGSQGQNGIPQDTLMANADPIITWLSYISLIYSSLTFVAHIGNPGETEFALQSLVAFVYALPWLGLIVFKKVRFNIPSKKRYGTLLIMGGIVTGITFFIQFFIGLIIEAKVFYSIFPVEIMFFYVNMAIAETILWNMTVHIILMNLFYFILRINQRRGKDLPKKFIAILFTNFTISLLFALTHWEVYQGNVLLIGSMFLGMSMWEFFHELTKSPLVALIAHLVLNSIVGGVILMTLI